MKIKRDKPARRPDGVLSCGHPDDGHTPCWRCNVKKLRSKWYGGNNNSNSNYEKKEITMPIKMKKEPKVTVRETSVKEAMANGSGKKGRAPKTAKGKASKAAPEKKIVGKTLGLNIKSTWAHLFTENEKLAKQDKARSDDQITQFMNAEFPQRKSKTFQFVGHWRRMFNVGKLTEHKPSFESVRHDKEEKASKKSK